MKLKSIMDASLIEDGVWLEVPHPDTNETICKNGDKSLPWRAKIRSITSNAYRTDNLRQQQKNAAALQRAKGAVRKAVADKQVDASQGQWFASVLVCTDNMDVEKSGQVIPTADDIAQFIDRENPESAGWQWFVQWVCAQSATGANYGVADENPTEGVDEKTPDSPTT